MNLNFSSTPFSFCIHMLPFSLQMVFKKEYKKSLLDQSNGPSIPAFCFTQQPTSCPGWYMIIRSSFITNQLLKHQSFAVWSQNPLNGSWQREDSLNLTTFRKWWWNDCSPVSPVQEGSCWWAALIASACARAARQLTVWQDSDWWSYSLTPDDY